MGKGSTIRYGEDAGLVLAASESIAAGASKDVAGVELAIPSDVEFLALDPFATAGATDSGVTLDYEFVGVMATEALAAYDTNPQRVRLGLESAGFNQGPIDHLPVKGYRKLKLNRIKNNSTSESLSGINCRYRLLR